ncbi:MAG: hypothetical protein K2K74_05310 [Lachnospiraceae bacterium]|nr:hypothetical protein [Lachnospiraceae bacterium]
MTKRTFITDYERESCRKVADAFAELYEQVNIVVKDAGKYGFVKLYCYEPYCGFCNMTTFIDSNDLFHDLWEEWWHEQVFTLALGTPLIDLDYPDILKALPLKKQEEIMSKKIYFKEKCGL